MQTRSKAYLQFISLCRALRDLTPPNDDDASAATSPSLTYAAIVLALLLAILEADLHRGELQAMGLVSDEYAVESALIYKNF